MSNASYYTYRIRIANQERVQVEKRDSSQNLLGEPGGKFGYNGDLRLTIDSLAEQAYQNDLWDDHSVKALGEALFMALFDDGLRQDFVAFYNQVVVHDEQLLRLELDVDETLLPDLAALPWEFMRVPVSANLGILWLSTARKLVFSRRRTQWFAAKPIQLKPQEKVRIALVIAAPSDLGPVVYDKVEAGLKKLAAEQSDRFELLPVLNGASAAAVDELLAQKPHIFHFIGHGRFSATNHQPKAELAFVDGIFGEAKWVDSEFFASLFNTHRPGVVLLHACEGGTLSASQAFVGTASRVVQQNVPVVAAMQYPVTNDTALHFALRFYQDLAKGEPVDAAAQNGRRAIALDTQYKSRDFATPVLFMRVADGYLFNRASTNEKPIIQPSENDDTVTIPPAPPTLTVQQIGKLGGMISKAFSLEELRLFCTSVGVDYDNLPDGGKTLKAQSLASYCQRHTKVADLWRELHLARRHVEWSQALI